MAAKSTPAVMLSDPNWLAHRYDPGHDAVHFISTSRDVRHAAPFLTDRDLPPTAAPLVLARADVRQTRPPAPLHFIFHSAYCCSTLLANALDLPGIASTLKEPVILNDIVGWRHRGGDPQKIQTVLTDALGLLSRPFLPGEATIAKPSNVVNALIPAMLALRPDATCLLLHAPLPVYLASIARKGMTGRLWVRDLLAKQLRDNTVRLGFNPDDYFGQTDLQVAAVGWLAQQQMFGEVARRWPKRVRTLDSEVLLEQPGAAISALADHFGLAVSANDATAIAGGAAFQQNSKDGRAYSRADRLVEQEDARALYADELSKVEIWARAVADSAGFSLDLPQPLIS